MDGYTVRVRFTDSVAADIDSVAQAAQGDDRSLVRARRGRGRHCFVERSSPVGIALLGHGGGGQLAPLFAATHPDLTQAVVRVSSRFAGEVAG